MTKKYIPQEKMGKKARKQADAAKRRTWECSPAQRIVESRKHYKRTNKAFRCRCDEAVDFFCFFARRPIKNRVRFGTAF